MVKHIVDLGKCRGCGECVDNCSLELWVLVNRESGTGKIARAIEEAAIVCHTCGMCSEGCPEKAIVLVNEE